MIVRIEDQEYYAIIDFDHNGKPVAVFTCEDEAKLYAKRSEFDDKVISLIRINSLSYKISKLDKPIESNEGDDTDGS